MSKKETPVAIDGRSQPLRPSLAPVAFATLLASREKRALGDVFGLKNFGVNLTKLAPGGRSSFRHAHLTQDEFVYILQGHVVLVTDAGETPMSEGMCAGFVAGSDNAHHLINRSEDAVWFLEIGDRSPGDHVHYPDDDLAAAQDDAGKWHFTHKDGSPY